MPRRRWITHDGETLTLRGWAERAGIAPGTLAYRLDRRGLPMCRVLAIGLLDKRESALCGKAGSPWRESLNFTATG